jgi:hypothetical protein
MLGRAAATAGVSLALFVGGCREGGVAPVTALADHEARARWEARGPSSYSYELAAYCFCAPETIGPVVVTVVDGAVQSRTYKSTGAAVPALYADFFPRIDDLFDMVRSLRSQRLERLTVTYHPVLGYPARIEVDHCRNCTDDGALYLAENLQPR